MEGCTFKPNLSKRSKSKSGKAKDVGEMNAEDFVLGKQEIEDPEKASRPSVHNKPYIPKFNKDEFLKKN
jgi:hypothetical protein